VRELTGSTISRGVDIPALNRQRLWDFVPTAKAGDTVSSGSIIGTVNETSAVVHKIMVPHGVSGVIESIEAGSFNITQTICRVKGAGSSVHEVTMLQKWPVRKSRPYIRKYIRRGRCAPVSAL
jgi:V/A-type H+-transporting ATPase subunit A